MSVKKSCFSGENLNYKTIDVRYETLGNTDMQKRTLLELEQKQRTHFTFMFL